MSWDSFNKAMWVSGDRVPSPSQLCDLRKAQPFLVPG